MKLLPGASRHSPRSKTAHRWIAVPAGAPLSENSPPRDEPLGPQATADPEPLARPRFAPILTSAMPAVANFFPKTFTVEFRYPLADPGHPPEAADGNGSLASEEAAEEGIYEHDNSVLYSVVCRLRALPPRARFVQGAGIVVSGDGSPPRHPVGCLNRLD